MARLTRVRQKVFASNASNNGVFGSLQAGNPQTSNDVATLQSLSAFENGWDDAIEQGDKLPPLEEFQGIQYGISYQQAYMLQEGIAEWDANTPYYKGGLVKTISGTSFKLYCSLADNNTNKAVTNTSYWKKVMDSDDLYAYDSAVVHLAGNETITGLKTFSSLITFSGGVIRKASWTGGTTPSSTIQVGYNFEDASGTNCGSVRKQYGSNGSYYTQMVATKTDGTGAINIGIGYNENGLVRATAPAPDTTTATNSTQIATTGWVNSNGNNVVHLSGTETITGNKTLSGSTTLSGSVTFSGSVSLGSSATATTQAASDNSTKVATTAWANTTGNNIVHVDSSETITGEKTFTGTFKTRKATTGYYSMYNYNDAITIGTAPSANTAVQFNMEDSVGGQNHRVGGWFIRYNTDGSTQTGLTAYKPDGTVQTNSSLGITYPSSGDPYAYAPTQSDATDNSEKIATTKWVNNFLSNSTIVEKISGYFAPKMSASVSITSGYITPSAGYIRAYLNFDETSNGQVKIDGAVAVETTTSSVHDMGNHKIRMMFYVGKGQTITFTNATCYFIPIKGS